MYACLFLDVCYFGDTIKNIILLVLFFLFPHRNLSVRKLFHSFGFEQLCIIFQVVHLQFILKLAINIRHCSFHCYVFHPMKKINKKLQKFARFLQVKGLFFYTTYSDSVHCEIWFSSFIEANIYMWPGEHSGVKIMWLLQEITEP